MHNRRLRIHQANRFLFLERLNKQKVTIYTGLQIKSVTDKGTVMVDQQGQIQEVPVDQVVLASGYLPQTELRDQLERNQGWMYMLWETAWGRV